MPKNPEPGAPGAAGPEMDAEVARAVFGETVAPFEEGRGYFIVGEDGESWGVVPPYSTDRIAAMLVVDYFTTGPAEHPCTHHFEMVYYAGEDQWMVEIGARECGGPERPFRLPQEDWSESLPEAICRAALQVRTAVRASRSADGGA